LHSIGNQRKKVSGDETFSEKIKFMELNFWYKNPDTTQLATQFKPLFLSHGFKINMEGASTWDRISLKRRKVFFDISQRIEHHSRLVLFTRSTHPDICISFFKVFREVIASPGSHLREAVLDLEVSDEFPFFTLEEFRPNPPPTIYFKEGTGRARNSQTGNASSKVAGSASDAEREYISAGDVGYWEMRGAKLHFVADPVFALDRTPSGGEWATDIAADLFVLENGVLFDCGWNDWAEGENRRNVIFRAPQSLH